MNLDDATNARENEFYLYTPNNQSNNWHLTWTTSAILVDLHKLPDYQQTI